MAKILLYGDCKELGYTPPESICDIIYNIQLRWTDDTVNKISENIDNNLRCSMSITANCGDALDGRKDNLYFTLQRFFNNNWIDITTETNLAERISFIGNYTLSADFQHNVSITENSAIFRLILLEGSTVLSISNNITWNKLITPNLIEETLSNDIVYTKHYCDKTIRDYSKTVKYNVNNLSLLTDEQKENIKNKRYTVKVYHDSNSYSKNTEIKNEVFNNSEFEGSSIYKYVFSLEPNSNYLLSGKHYFTISYLFDDNSYNKDFHYELEVKSVILNTDLKVLNSSNQNVINTNITTNETTFTLQQLISKENTNNLILNKYKYQLYRKRSSDVDFTTIDEIEYFGDDLRLYTKDIEVDPLGKTNFKLKTILHSDINESCYIEKDFFIQKGTPKDVLLDLKLYWLDNGVEKDIDLIKTKCSNCNHDNCIFDLKCKVIISNFEELSDFDKNHFKSLHEQFSLSVHFTGITITDLFVSKEQVYSFSVGNIFENTDTPIKGILKGKNNLILKESNSINLRCNMFNYIVNGNIRVFKDIESNNDIS